MDSRACVTFVLLFIVNGAALRNDFDHSGSEFYITFVPKPFQNTPSEIQVYVTTPEHVPVTFNITDHGRNFSQTATVAPGGVKVFTFSGEEYELRSTTDRTKAFIVSTEDDRRIYVYGAYDQESTIDSFVALPPHDLGIATYTYYAVLLRNGTAHDATIGIVSARDNTVITITPTVDITVSTQPVRAGEAANITLQKEETLLILFTGDLTGTKFTTSMPISFFSGDECSTIPRVGFGLGCDQIIEQLPPVEAWGRTFATVPLKTRMSFDLFRVFAAESDTELNISCVTSEGSAGFTGTFSLPEAGSADLLINSTDHCWWEATKRVLLLQFSASKYVDGVESDPFMALVPAISQYTNSFILPTLNSSLNNFLHYLNILIPAQYHQPDQILLNGRSLQSLSANFTAITVDGVTKAYGTQLTISGGVHTLTHGNPNGRMGALLYGFTRIGSYGHSGGFRYPAPSAPQGLQWSMSCPLGNLTWDPLPADQLVTMYEVNITLLSGDGEAQTFRTNQTYLEVALSPSTDCAVVVRGFAGLIAGDVSETLMFSKGICPPSAPQGLQWSMSCPLVNLTWDPLPADQLVTVYEVNITLLSGDGEAQTFRTNQTYLEVALSPSTDCAVVVRGFAGLIAGDVSETLMFSKGICPPSAPQGLQWFMSCPLGNLTWDPLPADQLVTVYEVNITLLSGDGEAQTFRTNQTYLEVALSPSTDCAVVVRGFAGLIAGDVSETLMFSKGICPPSAPQGLQWSMSCPLVNLTWDPLPADQLVTVYEVNITLLSGDGEAQTFRTNQTYLEVALSPSTDCAVVVRGFAGLIAGDVSETLMFSKGICPPSAPQGLQWSMSCPLGNLTWDPLPADQLVTVYEVNITLLSGDGEAQTFRTNQTYLEVALSPSTDCAVVVRGFAGLIAGDVSEMLMLSKGICPTESEGEGSSDTASSLVSEEAIAVGSAIAAFVILVLFCIALTLVLVFICIIMRRRKGGDAVRMIPDNDGGTNEVILFAPTTKPSLTPTPYLEFVPHKGSDAPEEATLTYEPLDLTMQSTELNGDHHDLEPSTIFTNNHEVCTSRDDTYEPLLLRILSDIDEAATAAGAGANGDIYEPMELRTLQLRKDTMYTVPNQASRTASPAVPSADQGRDMYVEVLTGSSETKFIQPPDTVGEIYNLLSAEKCIEIPRASIVTEERLGSGAFGQVCRGTWSTPYGPLEVAVKMLKEGSSEEDQAKFLQEGAIMGQFKHPHILRMLGAVTVDQPSVLVLEMAHKGDLKKHLRAIKQATTESAPMESSLPQQLLTFCREVADGMCYLAHKGYIHRDLAARNVLLDKRLKCKIADFGMSRGLSEDSIYYMAESAKFPIRWTAPEALISNKFSSSSDVWSFGILMYEIWSLGGKPFANLKNRDVLCHIKQGKSGVQPQPPNCPNAIYQIMKQCWEQNHHERPTFDSLVSAFAVPDRQLLQDMIQEDPSMYI